MRRFPAKRFGQSGHELALAVFFSFFLHALLVVGSLVVYRAVVPKAHFPPYYLVKLVGQPADLSRPPRGQETPPPREEAKPAKAAQKAKKAALKPIKAAPKKGALPEIEERKPKSAPQEAAKPEAVPAQPAPAPPSAATAGKGEGVAVTTPQQDFKFSWYLGLVRDKIGQNWIAPPDAKDARARVIFTINRSGWVGEVNLDAEHSSGTYGFKAAAVRAIRSSNPFPPLPEEFSKQSLEFSVDLMAEE